MFAASLPRRIPRWGGVPLAVVLLFGALSLSACADAPGETETGSTGSSPDTAPLPGPADPDDLDEGPPPLTWLPPGPADPSDPPPNFWYELLASRQCDTLIAAEDGPLWTAAGWLCDGLNTGDEASWSTGIATFGQLDEAPVGCLESAAFTFLERLVAHYEEHGQPEEFVSAPAGDTACALGLTGVSAESSGFAEVSVCREEAVRLMGRLMDVTSADVGGVLVDVENTGTHRYEFMPPAADPGEVTVTAYADDGPIPGSATLTYTSEGCPDGQN